MFFNSILKPLVLEKCTRLTLMLCEAKCKKNNRFKKKTDTFLLFSAFTLHANNLGKFFQKKEMGTELS